MEVIKQFPPLISSRRAPVNLAPEDTAIFAGAMEFRSDGPHVAIWRDIDLLNGNLYKFPWARSFESYTRVQTRRLRRRMEAHGRLLVQKAIGPKGNIERGTWVLDEWSHNYFHWFSDALPRLALVDDLTASHPLILPRRFDRLAYVKRSLEMLAVPFQLVDDKVVYGIGELVLPNHVCLTGNHDGVLIRRTASKLAAHATAATRESNGPSEKLFISRSMANYRRLQNEDEITSLVQARGYRVVHAELLSFDEQISLFSGAKVIAGLHGAGLTNMMFMRPECTIVEIRKRGDPNNCFFSMASELDLEYRYVIAEHDGTHYLHYLRGDCHVDAAALAQVLP